MITKKVLNPNRIRRIDGGFSFIPHRFLTDGFLAALDQQKILVYFFLVLAADRNGLSFYAYDAICSLLGLSVDEYIEARDGLMEKDLIAYDSTIFQVLDVPKKPVPNVATKPPLDLNRRAYRSHIKNLIQYSLWEAKDGR
ncbi:MAG: hypothetical protein GQ554_08795 [Deltaproteobacteria bacterium]|nr:hypothetical protein [Deltaproteobacteria bacterium]